MDSTALIPVQYGLDTFYFVICGALVMWMAAGFAMLEAGLVRAKNTAEILTKNIVLYALASIMYLLVGYYIMYSSPDGGILPSLGFLIGDENAVDVVAAGGEDAPYYSARADFFFQIVFAATCMSVVSGAVAERMKLWAFIAFAVVMTGFIYPVQGFWKWGGGFLDAAGFLDFAGSGIVHMAGAAAALAGAPGHGAVPRRRRPAPAVAEAARPRASEFLLETRRGCFSTRVEASHGPNGGPRRPHQVAWDDDLSDPCSASVWQTARGRVLGARRGTH